MKERTVPLSPAWGTFLLSKKKKEAHLIRNYILHVHDDDDSDGGGGGDSNVCSMYSKWLVKEKLCEMQTHGQRDCLVTKVPPRPKCYLKQSTI